MTAAYIHQIYYSEATRHSLDPGFIGLDNLVNERPDWMEYWPIRRFLRDNRLDADSYYGFLSPEFKNKTHLDSSTVHRFVENQPAGKDVILFSPGFDQQAFYFNLFEQGAAYHQETFDMFRECVALVAPEVNFNRLLMDSRNSVICNYLVAKPRFWAQWLEKCELIFALAEENATGLARKLNAAANYIKGSPQNKVFFIERVASLLLATQRQWSVAYFDPAALPYTDSSLRNFPHEMIMFDSLKIAYAENGLREYIETFKQLRENLMQHIGVKKLEPRFFND